MSKRITKSLSVVKDLPDGEVAEGLLWAYASVESVDMMGDVVRIAGISWDDYHQPPARHLKILASHARSLPSGEPPIVGRVEKFLRTVVNGVPALMFAMSWATDGEGNVTPLAKLYKDLYDGGYMESFSVGIIVDEARDTDTGIEIIKSSLFEISAVAVPANADAHAIKALKELGVEVEEEKKEADPHTTQQSYEDVMRAALQEHVVPLTKSLGDTQALLASLVDRIESLESAVVIHTQSREPRGVDNRDAEAEKSLHEVNARLRELVKFLGK